MKTTLILAFKLTLCLALSACATKMPQPILVTGETALIQGKITETTAKEFKEALGRGRISRILIASGGGSVEAALDIAKEIRDLKIDVEVIGDCFSSCANYIFPAGASKTISGRGIVAWHGNMSHLLYLHKSGEKRLSDANLAMVQNLARLENEFFSSIGVDQYLCWFAKIEPYKVRNLYFLDVDDMARFGVTNVKVPEGYERMDVSRYNRLGVLGLENLQYVKVDWSNIPPPEKLN